MPNTDDQTPSSLPLTHSQVCKHAGRAAEDTPAPALTRPKQCGRAPDGRYLPRSREQKVPANKDAAKKRRYTYTLFLKELLDTVQDDDVRQVTRKLIDQAKAGDVHAIKLFLKTVLGDASPSDITNPPLIKRRQR